MTNKHHRRYGNAHPKSGTTKKRPGERRKAMPRNGHGDIDGGLTELLPRPLGLGRRSRPGLPW